MSYALSADAVVAAQVAADPAVPAPVPVQNAPASARTPNFTGQSAGLMAVAAIPWLPPVIGGLIGRRCSDSAAGTAYGIAGGALLSLLILRAFLKKTAGVIT